MELYEDRQLWFGAKGTNVPRLKKYLSQVKSGSVSNSVLKTDEVGSTQSATETVKKILGDGSFQSPKPVALIKHFLHLSTTKEGIILDSFAGSGTTAHAVLELNKEDGGNRKFILVECEDYADEITAERVRRVINGVPNAKNGALKAGLGGTFAFCKLGRELDIEKILTGEDLPDYDALARHVSYTATGAALESIESGADHFFGENATHRMHMIYRPDVDFLCSNESAITRELAQRIGAAAKKAGKTALVFAPWKFISQKELTQNGVTFCQLPYAIHRMFGNSLGE